MRWNVARFVVCVVALVIGACGENDTPSADPSTTQPGATTCETSAGSTSEPLTVPHAVVLRHDGLDVVSFGQQVDTVARVLTELLGPPDLEQVQVSPDVDRDVQWNEPFLYLQFTTWRWDGPPPEPIPEGPVFHYYLTTSDRFATDANITAGSSVAELEDAYPGVIFHRPCGDPRPEFLVDSGGEWPQLPLFGLLDGEADDPGTRIVHIGAGWDRTPC